MSHEATLIYSESLLRQAVFAFWRRSVGVGFLLALIGWAIFLSHTLPFLLLPVYVAYMNRFQISPEERALSAKFGDEYETYKQAVSRWL